MRKLPISPSLLQGDPHSIIKLFQDIMNDRRVNIGDPYPLTIASNAITIPPSVSFFSVDGGGASTDLKTITGGVAGDLIIIYPVNSAHVIVLKDATGNILCTGDTDITLNNSDLMALCIFDGTNWKAASFSGSSALSQVLTGYVASSGAITAADTILSAIEKLVGNIPNASYRNILAAQNVLTPGGGTLAAGTFAMSAGSFYIGTTIYGGSANQAPITDIYIAAADFPTTAGITTKLKLRAQLHTNHTAPGITITVSLYPLTRPGSAGGANTILFTLGTPVGTLTFTTPAADSSFNQASADFALPADGYYCLGITTSGAGAANSHTEISAMLQMRNA